MRTTQGAASQLSIFSERKQTVLARLSECGLYRYTLARDIPGGSGVCTFVMLNPSTANAEKLDPTCTRCLNFAKQWGYGRLNIVNVYALRSTDPRGLWKVEDPIGPENGKFIRATVYDSDLVICAWGNIARPEDAARVVRIIELTGQSPKCLRVSKAGSPCHPLYLPGNLEPIPYVHRNSLSQ